MGLLEGRVAIVTGGTSGIGKAIAERFAAEGARVVSASRRTGCDVTHEADVRRLVRGRVDILVNAAGIGFSRRIEKTKRRDWDRVLATNLTGAFLCSRAVFPIMKRNGGGEIVMISSVCGKDAWEGTGAYSASKHGMMALAGALLDEGLAHGIRVSCICPGMVDTPMVRRRKPGLIAAADVAAAALYLVTLGPNVVVKELRLDRRGALL